MKFSAHGAGVQNWEGTSEHELIYVIRIAVCRSLYIINFTEGYGTQVTVMACGPLQCCGA